MFRKFNISTSVELHDDLEEMREKAKDGYPNISCLIDEILRNWVNGYRIREGKKEKEYSALVDEYRKFRGN